MFDFIYPHNSYLFSGIPQINVAADKNKINNPVLLSNKQTYVYFYVTTLENQSPIRKQK